MKLLTINTHSLIEKNYESKLNLFADAISHHHPDIIAMQEVNQTQNSEIISESKISKLTVCQKSVPLRCDNHAFKTVQLLNDRGLEYYWAWLPIKTGYDKFDEGLSILSHQEILKTDVLLISKCENYENWKTRKVLGIQTENGWFYSIHMGWWNDKEEPFKEQWEKINTNIKNKENVWLMGDFNSRADVRNEGYDYVISNGWNDTYITAKEKDEGFTVTKTIDGWGNNAAEKMRIDYILSNKKVYPTSSKVIFNGINEPEISDHYGILLTV